MLRSGDEYLASLRDGRRIYLGGELVTDVTTHPAFRNTARSFARIYDRKREDQNFAAMSFAEDGERFTSWFLLPKSRQDLEQRAECHRRVAEWSYGLLGRSPDHVPAFVGGMAMMPELFDANRKGFGQNVIDYFNYLKQGRFIRLLSRFDPARVAGFQTLQGHAGAANPALTIVKEDARWDRRQRPQAARNVGGVFRRGLDRQRDSTGPRPGRVRR